MLQGEMLQGETLQGEMCQGETLYIHVIKTKITSL